MTGQLTKGWGVEEKIKNLFGRLANWEDGRQVTPKKKKKKNHLIKFWMPGSFIEQGGVGGECEEVKSKDH